MYVVVEEEVKVISIALSLGGAIGGVERSLILVVPPIDIFCCFQPSVVAPEVVALCCLIFFASC